MGIVQDVDKTLGFLGHPAKASEYYVLTMSRSTTGANLAPWQAYGRNKQEMVSDRIHLLDAETQIASENFLVERRALILLAK